MNRHGFTQVELLCSFTVTMLLLRMTGGMLHEVLSPDHGKSDPPVELVDMACDRLRQDAAHGARLVDGALLAGTHRWVLSGSLLLRDGRPLIHVGSSQMRSVDGCIRVRLTPAHLPERGGGALAMTRSGFLATSAAFLMLTATMCVTVVVGQWSWQREQACAHHLRRVQGREWCLGAQSLPKGAHLTIGSWSIAHLLDGSVRADGPTGSYQIDAQGRESWGLNAGTRPGTRSGAQP